MLLGLVKPICYIAENGEKSRSCFDSPREAELLNGKKTNSGATLPSKSRFVT